MRLNETEAARLPFDPIVVLEAQSCPRPSTIFIRAACRSRTGAPRSIINGTHVRAHLAIAECGEKDQGSQLIALSLATGDVEIDIQHVVGDETLEVFDHLIN